MNDAPMHYPGAEIPVPRPDTTIPQDELARDLLTYIKTENSHGDYPWVFDARIEDGKLILSNFDPKGYLCDTCEGVFPEAEMHVIDADVQWCLNCYPDDARIQAANR